jgi:hypothetical protein
MGGKMDVRAEERIGFVVVPIRAAASHGMGVFISDEHALAVMDACMRNCHDIITALTTS